MRLFFSWVTARGLQRSERWRARRLLWMIKLGRGLTTEDTAWAHRYGIQTYVSLSGSYPEFVKDLFRV